MNRPVAPDKPLLSGSPQFVTTEWTVVRDAAQESAAQMAALEKLCGRYWYPLYAYVRRRGYGPEEAADLTQEFFARVLSNRWLCDATPELGRFRTFLLTALTRFLANEYDRSKAVKRGGDRQFTSWDQQSAETRYLCEPATLDTPDRVFERRWALTVLEQALQSLKKEVANGGDARQFEALSPFLSREPESGEYEKVASGLHMSRGGVSVAVHRLRGRYRQFVREEIAATVSSASAVEEELQYLFTILRG
jgi:RNA polymerase sigma factor (sigma-70 family)